MCAFKSKFLTIEDYIAEVNLHGSSEAIYRAQEALDEGYKWAALSGSDVVFYVDYGDMGVALDKATK